MPCRARNPKTRTSSNLLRRAFIEARYSRSYAVTPDELLVMRAMVLDLARRMRTRGMERGVQSGIQRGIERGREEGLQLGERRGIERGREEGLQLGERRGIERGREEGLNEGRIEERARAVLDVLRHRGVATTNQQEERLLACRDGDTLERWWARVWTVASADELLG
ncbi:MAG: hypothetical protein QM784_19920 [Polyangiaceae bacterium]